MRRSTTTMLACVVLAMVLLAAGPLAAEGQDPWQNVYATDPVLRDLMDWVTLQCSFDHGSLVPDMAVGDYGVQVAEQPQFEPGVLGLGLVAGAGSQHGIIARGPNAPLATRGALSLWVKPLEWTRENGGNTVFLMTTNASFYLQRQGPAHREDGSLKRHEGVQFLLFSKSAGNGVLQLGTTKWAADQWRLVCANWNWPLMSISLDGGPFQSVSVKGSPPNSEFGGLIVGARGGERTVLDELTIYRRPLTEAEARAVYDALKPPTVEEAP
jgi:hypothetical protein